MSQNCGPTSSASPACRWSRAPRSAHFDAASGRYTFYAGGGAIVRPKKEVAIILGIAPEQVRVIAREVGGNFGTRNSFYPEFALVCLGVAPDRPAGEMDLRSQRGVPQRLCRPRFPDRSRSWRSTPTAASSGCGRQKHQQSRRLHRLLRAPDQGHAAHVQPLPHAGGRRGRARVLSNTPPTAPYRSAGRPEAMFVIERLIDLAAARARLRPGRSAPAQPHPDDACHTNPFGMTYDSGDYRRPSTGPDARGLERVRSAPRETAARGLRRGIGLGGYVESQSGAPNERAEVTVLPEGTVEMVIGTLSSGQGHETSFAQLAQRMAGRAARRGALVTGDTDRVAVGGGSHSGRSMRLAATTVPARATKSSPRAASSPPTCSKPPKPTSTSPTAASGGRTDRSLDLFAVAAAALDAESAEELRGPLADRRGREPGRLLSVRLPRLRGRGRCRDRAGRDRPLHRRSTMSAAP